MKFKATLVECSQLQSHKKGNLKWNRTLVKLQLGKLTVGYDNYCYSVTYVLSIYICNVQRSWAIKLAQPYQ